MSKQALKDVDCRNATCPPDLKRRRLTDGAGLYLEVSPGGAKRWFWKFYPDGKESRLALGSYGSATALWQAAEDSTASDKPLTVLYVGDFDPAGMHMSMVDLPGRIQRYRGQIDFRRVALVERDLPGLPNFDASTKLGDPRHRWFVDRYGYQGGQARIAGVGQAEMGVDDAAQGQVPATPSCCRRISTAPLPPPAIRCAVRASPSAPDPWWCRSAPWKLACGADT